MAVFDSLLTVQFRRRLIFAPLVALLRLRIAAALGFAGIGATFLQVAVPIHAGEAVNDVGAGLFLFFTVIAYHKRVFLRFFGRLIV